MGPESATSPRGKHGVWSKVATFAVAASLLYFTVAVYGDLRDVRAMIAGFDWWRLPVALAASSGAQLLRFGRWHYYVRRLGLPLTSGESLLIHLAGMTMSVTPGKFGEVIKSLLIHDRTGASATVTAPIVVAERLTDLIAMVLLVAGLSLIFDRGAALALVGGAVAAFLLPACASRSFADLAVRLVAHMPLASRAAPKLRGTFENVRATTTPKMLAVATLFPAAAFWLDGLVLRTVFEGVSGVRLGPLTCTFAYTAPALAGGLSMLPGGLGVTDLGITALLHLLQPPGLSGSGAAAASLLTRLCTLWWDVLVGLNAFMLLRLNGRASRRLARQPGTAELPRHVSEE